MKTVLTMTQITSSLVIAVTETLFYEVVFLAVIAFVGYLLAICLCKVNVVEPTPRIHTCLTCRNRICETILGGHDIDRCRIERRVPPHNGYRCGYYWER